MQTVAKQFKQGLESLPEVRVAWAFSGSMMQEVFYLYAQHFIKSLPVASVPTILLLDGHASRWTVQQALRLLMENKVYSFFIASHTSIWAQPNHCEINKQFHWALEQSARAERRDGNATVANFNEYSASVGSLIWKKREPNCESLDTTQQQMPTNGWGCIHLIPSWKNGCGRLRVSE